VGGAIFLTCGLAMTLVTLPFSASWYAVQDIEHAVRAAPSIRPLTDYGAVRSRLENNAWAAWCAPAGPAVHRMSGWMGYDALGRSLFHRCMLGWLVSLVIGISAAVISVCIGVLWGSSAALLGGAVDTVLMRIVDVLFGLPYILMVVLVQIALRQPLRTLLGAQGQVATVAVLVLAIGGVSWLTMARVIRGQVLALRSQPFVDAARIAGAGPLHILRDHLLPNLVGPISVYATLVVPQAILQESFLSFLGIGIQQPLPSLGRLTADGVQAVNTFVSFWWLIAFPSGLLLFTLLTLNFLGAGLREAFDPKAALTPALG
jgi:ABC-type dipeptide/oligopeptide/nickel transport system permease subunit